MELIGSQIGMRPEEDLLLCCSRVNMESEKIERIKVLLRGEINWPYLIQTALRHGLVPLLYKNLKATHPNAIPHEALDQLQKYFLANAGRNIFLNKELNELLNLFETHGIPAIPYKGPALAASIYGDIALRQFSDLDILVQKQDVPRCRDIMVSRGYRPDFQLTDVNAKHYLQSRNELSFTRSDGKVLAEIQWGIVPPYFSFSVPSQYLWNNVQQSAGGDSGFRTLSPEIELIILCVHGNKDLWARLLWVCDVAEFIRVNQELDWDWVIGLSRTLGSLRMLFLGLFLSKDLLNTSIPDEVMKQVKVDPMVRRLAREVQKRLFNGANGSCGILKNSIFYLKARERLHDRVQYCLRLGMTTTPGDWTLFQLPGSLFPLYYLTRPFRLATKYGLKSLNGIFNPQK